MRVRVAPKCPHPDLNGDEMASKSFKQPEYYTEAEMANMLRIDVKTLKSRRSRGTNHPPYVEITRGHVLYPKEPVEKWLSTLNVIWEVRRVG